MWYMRWVETGRVPDGLIRVVLRVGLNWARLRRYTVSPAKALAEKRALIDKFTHSPIAIRTDDPNVQHYEKSVYSRSMQIAWIGKCQGRDRQYG